MSNNKLSTKDKIVEKAIEMFNEHGIEYVGVRELAKALQTKAGNITYYFPTKDDLVAEVGNRLGEANNQIIVKNDDLTPDEFIVIFEQAFLNHYRFRCLFLSYANVLRQNEVLRKQYHERQLLRKETIIGQIKSMMDNGHLKKLDKEEIQKLYDTVLIITRFWVANATIEENLEPVNKAISKYIELIRWQLFLVATVKGQRYLRGHIVKKKTYSI